MNELENLGFLISQLLIDLKTGIYIVIKLHSKLEMIDQKIQSK